MIQSILWVMLSSFHLFAYGQQASDWKVESQRPEIAPVSGIDTQILSYQEPTLRLSGGGKDYAAGYWYKIVDAIPGEYYHFRTHFKSKGVDEPGRSILARVVWHNEA
ncbi:MAG TPA: hypothetical protein VIQ51_05385, partial [Chryseosolibacter sp.]